MEPNPKANLASVDGFDDCKLRLTRFKQADKIAGMKRVSQGSALGIDEGQHGNDACTLHRIGEVSLLLSGKACETTGKDLAAFGDELLEQIHILVIDGIAGLIGERRFLKKNWT